MLQAGAKNTIYGDNAVKVADMKKLIKKFSEVAHYYNLLFLTIT